MNSLLRAVKLSLILVALLTLASCLNQSREERQAEARERQGLILAELADVIQESEGARLYREKTCVTCHGADGITPLLPNYPVIAKQGEQYALKQMLDIKSGERANAQSAAMKPIIDGVTDEEMAILAKFIATELGAGKTIGGPANEGLPGAKLFKSKTCVACHGANGNKPILKEYPSIAGNNLDYVKQQMLDIKSGDRANGMNVAGMKGIMHLVTIEEIDLLAEYVASLPR